MLTGKQPGAGRVERGARGKEKKAKVTTAGPGKMSSSEPQIHLASVARQALEEVACSAGRDPPDRKGCSLRHASATNVRRVF